MSNSELDSHCELDKQVAEVVLQLLAFQDGQLVVVVLAVALSEQLLGEGPVVVDLAVARKLLEVLRTWFDPWFEARIAVGVEAEISRLEFTSYFVVKVCYSTPARIKSEKNTMNTSAGFADFDLGVLVTPAGHLDLLPHGSDMSFNFV